MRQATTATPEERLERLLAFQTLLAQVSRRIGPALEVQPVLETALDAMRELVEFRGGTICLVDDGELYVAAADPAVSDDVARARLPVGQGVAGTVVATGTAAYSPDVDADPRVDPVLRRTGSNAALRSYLAVPLVCLGEVIGILQVDSVEPDAFDADDLSVLQGLATIVAGAIESARRYEEIRQLERLKADFIARVSHELRTPLTIIGGFTSTLRRHWEVLDGPDRESMLDRVTAANRRLTALVDELLTVTSYEAGMDEARPVEVALAELLATVRDESADPTRVAVDCNPSVRVVADPRLLRHAVALLVDNALKYAGDAQLRVMRWIDPPATVVEVRDHGPGIPDDLRPHLFERFTRGAHSEPGMGLGLALVRTLAGAMGGRVDVDAPADGGSRFRLVLPS